MATPPTVLVLGGAALGLRAAHELLKQLPAEYKVILVTPSTHLYWMFGSVRAVVKADQFGKDNAKLFTPIQDGFKAYPATRFEFVQGKATQLDPSSNSVVVVEIDEEGNEGSTRTISYTHVLIATGSSAHDGFPFKSSTSYKATLRALKDVNVKFEAAKTIVLSGAGPTGVETAGEVGTLWKGSGKKIYLLNKEDRVLPTTRDDVSATAEKLLTSVGVIVKNGVTVESESHKDGALELKLTNGETIIADLHVPTFGVTPNTEYIPADLLDAGKSVKIAPTFQSPSYPNVWAAGDAAAIKYKQAAFIPKQVPVVVGNIVAAAQGKDASSFKEYDDPRPPLVTPVGGGFAMGTGLVGSWKMWGILVWFFKGRDFFSGKAKGVVDGKE